MTRKSHIWNNNSSPCPRTRNTDRKRIIYTKKSCTKSGSKSQESTVHWKQKTTFKLEEGGQCETIRLFCWDPKGFRRTNNFTIIDGNCNCNSLSREPFVSIRTRLFNFEDEMRLKKTRPSFFTRDRGTSNQQVERELTAEKGEQMRGVPLRGKRHATPLHDVGGSAGGEARQWENIPGGER